MIELVVLFGLAAIGTLFGDPDAQRPAPASAGPAPGGAADRDTPTAGATRRAEQTERPASNGRASEDCADGAKHAVDDALIARFTAEAPEDASEPVDHDTLFGDTGLDDLLLAVPDQADTADARQGSDAAAVVDERVESDEALVIMIPADYAGPCEITLADRQSKSGAVVDVLLDGVRVTTVGGYTAETFPVEAISVLEEAEPA